MLRRRYLVDEVHDARLVLVEELAERLHERLFAFGHVRHGLEHFGEQFHVAFVDLRRLLHLIVVIVRVCVVEHVCLIDCVDAVLVMVLMVAAAAVCCCHCEAAYLFHA